MKHTFKMDCGRFVRYPQEEYTPMRMSPGDIIELDYIGQKGMLACVHNPGQQQCTDKCSLYQNPSCTELGLICQIGMMVKPFEESMEDLI